MGIGSGIPSISGNCILEDQGDYLIVALRIPKSVILSNLDMFGALAKYSGGSKETWEFQASSPPPPRFNPRRAWTVIGFSIALITATLLVPVISSAADEIIYSLQQDLNIQ